MCPIGQGITSDKSHFCIVPALDGEPTEADANDGYRMLRRIVDIPGSLYPVVIPRNRGGFWTLSDGRRLVRRTDSYTKRGIPELAIETHSGRVLALGDYDSISVLDPQSGWFETFQMPDSFDLGKARRLAYIPRWQATVIAADSGLYRLTDDRLELLLVANGQAGDAARMIFDVPELGAIAIVTAERELLLRQDDGQIFNLLSLSELQEASKGWWERVLAAFNVGNWANRVGDWFIDVDYLAHTGDLVITTLARVIHVPLEMEDGGFAPAAPIVLDEKEHISEFAIRWHVDPIQEYLAYRDLKISSDTEDRGLYRIRRGELQPVPGGNFDTLGTAPFVFEVPSRSLAIIKGARELLILVRDGSLAPIPGSSFDNLGPYNTWVYDFPSIGKVVVRTEFALFEFTEAGRLEALTHSETFQGAKLVSVTEMPASKAAIVFTDRGPFALDHEGQLKAVVGAHRADVYHAPSLINASYLAARGELLFAARNGLFLVVDRRIAGHRACGE